MFLELFLPWGWYGALQFKFGSENAPPDAVTNMEEGADEGSTRSLLEF